jgi:hypothetical protein
MRCRNCSLGMNNMHFFKKRQFQHSVIQKTITLCGIEYDIWLIMDHVIPVRKMNHYK